MMAGNPAGKRSQGDATASEGGGRGAFYIGGDSGYLVFVKAA